MTDYKNDLITDKTKHPCETCTHADTYFGDCTHPNFGPSKVSEAVTHCLNDNAKFYKPRSQVTEEA